MVWYYGYCFQNLQHVSSPNLSKKDLAKHFLIQRIKFCNKAIEIGLTEHSYYAMVSCSNLFSILRSDGNSSEGGGEYSAALKGIVGYAELYLSTNPDDPELIQDAKELLKVFGPAAKAMNAAKM